MEHGERQEAILSLLREKKRASVRELAGALYVSDMTIRRDLEKLAREGRLRRYHGGAVAAEEYPDYPVGMRMSINEKEKKDLGRRARAHLADGQTVYLDGSSTCAYVIPYLKEFRDIRVVTNSVQFLLMLAEEGIPCLLSGGDYYPFEMCLVGSFAEAFFREIYVDIAFFSCLGLSDDGCLSDNDQALTAIRKIVLHNAGKSVFLMDRSKLHSKCTYHICRTEEADDVIIA